MGQVTIDISSSIDGFIALPDDSSGPIHDWYFDGEVVNEQNSFFRTSPESAPVIEEDLTKAAALICGRRTYDLTNGWDGNHPLGAVTCFVVTHDPPHGVPDGATTFEYVTDGIDGAVDRAVAAAGDGDVYIMGGASVMWQALAAQRVDRFQLHLAHVLIGDGIRFFDGMETLGQRWPIDVTLARQIDAPGVTHLFFDVA